MKPRNLLITLLILAGACAAPLTDTPAPLIIFVTPTATQTLTPTVRPTSTPIPPSPTPQPTLSAVDAKSLILDLMRNNGDCPLSCLWGLIPGESDRRTMNSFMARFGGFAMSENILLSASNYSGGGGFILYFSEGDINVFVFFDYYLDGGYGVEKLRFHTYPVQEHGEGLDLVVKQIFGDPYYNQIFQYYMPSQILSAYGLPSEALIAPILADPGRAKPWEPFSLVLIYHELGVLIEYLVPIERVGDHYLWCPKMANDNTVIVWDPERETSLTEILNGKSGYGINQLNADYFKSIEEAASMTLDDFYLTFQDPNSATCVETPIDMWP